MRGLYKQLSTAAALILLTLSACAAYAQGAVQQSGPVSIFHVPAWFQNGIVADAGTPAAPYVNSLGLFNGAGCPFGISSQQIPGVATAPYSQFSICQTATSTRLNFAGVNGQPTPNVFFNIGGVDYPFPGPGNGTVIGPNSSTSGAIACYGSTSGTVLTNCSAGSARASISALYGIVGPQSGAASAWANFLSELVPGQLATEFYTSNGSGQLSGIYPYNISSYLGLSTQITASDDPPCWNGACAGDVPRSTLSLLMTDAGSTKTGVALNAISVCAQAGLQCDGATIIAAQANAAIADKLVGLEVDQQFSAAGGTPLAGSAGLYVVTLNGNSSHTGAGNGVALQMNGVGGYWSTGIECGTIITAGSCLAVIGGSLSMGEMIDTTSGTFINGAIVLGNYNGSNGQIITFQGPGGFSNPSSIYTDNTGDLVLLTQAAKAILAKSTSTSSSDAIFIAQNGSGTNAVTVYGDLRTTLAGAVKMTGLAGGSPATYACFDSGGNLVSSVSAC